MDFADFERITIKFWREHLTMLSEGKKTGRLTFKEGKILFPNILMVTNCDGYYVAELLGASLEYEGLSLKRSSCQSVYKYFNQFDESVDTPMFLLEGGNSEFYGMCLSYEGDFEAVKKRFPIAGRFSGRMIGVGVENPSGSFIQFGDTFESASFNNCLLVNQKGGAYRCKSILTLAVVKKTISTSQLKKFYSRQSRTEQIPAIHGATAGSEAIMIAGQFQNLYLSQGIHETTLGEFLRLHPEFVRKAFTCSEFLCEKSFLWKESKFLREEKSIKPDLLLRRSDGFYDICDLKTAAFKHRSLTNFKTSRRKFNSYVYDGIAQLNTYNEYFTYEGNAKHAFEVHGVKVSNPKLILVVGSWENFRKDDVEQAYLNHPGITIIDYDTFCQLYISAAEYGGVGVA